MEKLIHYYNKEAIIFYSIQENPTSGTFGDYLLLKKDLRSKDETSPFGTSEKAIERFQQLKFNTEFLEEMLAKHGNLHCVYCNKEDLKIYYWWQKCKRSDQASADHFFPKGKNPHLAKEKSNLRVCCTNCNNKKGNKIWEEKYPYK